jgi:DNA polymerase-4
MSSGPGERGERVVVHVLLERFRQAVRGRGFDDAVSLTERFDDVLERHGAGWSRPSADEAVLVSLPPWAEDGSPLDWAGSLRAEVLRELKLDCSIGIASTRIAARACARLARPRGILQWMEGHEDALLEGLPLEELDELRPGQLARLRSHGVRTLEELAGLAPKEARELLGSDGEKLVGLVRRVDRVSEGGDANRLSRALAVLVRRLELRLRGAGRKARGLELQLAYSDGVTRERYLLLAEPTSNREELWEAALRLADMHPRRAEAVSGLALTATGLTGSGGQLDLFGARGPREIRVHAGQAPRVETVTV